MPKFEGPVFGAPCWIDLTSGDLAKVKPFYSALFGWEYQEQGEEFGNYNIISVGGDWVGGAMQYSAEFMGPDEINAWMVYFATENAEGSLQKAQEIGGNGVTPAMPIPPMGTMATGVDSTGSMFGLWQPQELKGFAKWGEHGFPGWFELHTRNYDEAVKYYATFLSAEIKEMEMEGGPRYSTIELNGESQAGILDASGSMPEGVPNYWAVYFIVDDTDVAVKTAQEHGGTVMLEPTDTPFGRMSLLQDPQGAVFFVISGNGDQG